MGGFMYHIVVNCPKVAQKGKNAKIAIFGPFTPIWYIKLPTNYEEMVQKVLPAECRENVYVQSVHF